LSEEFIGEVSATLSDYQGSSARGKALSAIKSTQRNSVVSIGFKIGRTSKTNAARASHPSRTVVVDVPAAVFRLSESPSRARTFDSATHQRPPQSLRPKDSVRHSIPPEGRMF
jgi:hypothetical protein